MVNRTFGTGYNPKRIRRVMEIHAWTLTEAAKRRHTRPHTGLVQRQRTNERWSTDAIEIAGWNGEVVEAAFALDCCDRECLAWVAAPRDLTGDDIRGLMTDAAYAVTLGHPVSHEPGSTTRSNRHGRNDLADAMPWHVGVRLGTLSP